MRVSITAPNIALPLRVVDELPDLDVGLLEGQNGIGKTVAVKVLQLCTGDTSPWAANEDSWSSLCRLLGPITVEVQGLADSGHATTTGRASRTLRWQLDLSSHQNERPDHLADADFSAIELDDAPASLEDVHRLLEVYRIDGSEDMPETLGNLIRFETRLVDRAQQRFVAVSQALERQFERWSNQYEFDACRSFYEARNELHHKERQSREWTVRTAAMEQRVSTLRQAAEAVRLLAEVQGDTARSLVERQSKLERQVSTLAEKEASLTKQLTDAKATSQGQRKLLAELKAASDLYNRRLRTMVVRAQRAQAAAEKLGLEPTPDLDAALAVAAEDLRTAEQRLAEAEASAGVTPITDRLRQILVLARDEDLGERTVAVLPDRRLSALQLLAAVDARRDQLSRTPEGHEIQRLRERIASLQERQANLKDLQELAVAVTRAQANLAETANDIEALRKRTNPDSADRRLAELSASLNEVRSALSEENVALALVRQRRDRLGAGREAKDLANERDRLLVSAGIEESQLAGELSKLEAELAAASEARDRLRQELEPLRRAVEAGSTLIQQMIVGNEGTEGPLQFPADVVPAVAAESVLVLRDRVAQVASENRDVSNAANDVSNALHGLVSAIADSSPPLTISRGHEVYERVRRRWEDKLLQVFSSDAVSLSVFDGGSLERVNLQERQFEWIVNGDRRIRPFSAFSSGEQAFAYTQARIADLQAGRAANKLLVIDEFGAYLSADRRQRLTNLILRSVQVRRITQALLVLPLRSDLDDPSPQLPPGTQQSLDVVRERRWLTAPLAEGVGS